MVPTPSERQAASTTASHGPYLTIPEFARHTTLSESTVRRRIREGTIPVHQPGGKRHRILIDRNALRYASSSPTDADCPPAEKFGTANRRSSQTVGQVPLRGPRPQWMQTKH